MSLISWEEQCRERFETVPYNNERRHSCQMDTFHGIKRIRTGSPLDLGGELGSALKAACLVGESPAPGIAYLPG